MIALPEDVLLRVFELVCTSKTITHVRLSSLCRRFRATILNQASFWTYLSPSQSVQWREVQVSRSQGQGLIIDFSEPTHRIHWHSYFETSYWNDGHEPSGGPCPCADFLRFAIEYKQWWKEVTFTLDHLPGVEQQTIQDLLKDLALPSLKKLVVDPETRQDPGGSDLQVCLSWTMPVLQSLSCGIPFLTSLQQKEPERRIRSFGCTFDWVDYDCSQETVTGLRNTVIAGVEELELSFENKHSFFDGLEQLPMATTIADAERREEKVDFRDVKVLALRFSFAAAALAGAYLLRRFCFPGLEQLSIEIGCQCPEFGENEGPGELVEDSDDSLVLLRSYVSLFDWLMGPLDLSEDEPDANERFPNLAKIHIDVSGHDAIDQKVLEVELDTFIHGGHLGANNEFDVTGLEELFGLEVSKAFWPQASNAVETERSVEAVKLWWRRKLVSDAPRVGRWYVG